MVMKIMKMMVMMLIVMMMMINEGRASRAQASRDIPCTGESGHPVHQQAKIPCTHEAVTNVSQSWNRGFPVPGPAWEPLAGNPCLGTCSWEPLGNLLLGSLLRSLYYGWRPQAYSVGEKGFEKLRFPRIRNHSRTGSQFQELLVPKPQSYMFPVLGTSGSQTLAPMLPNLGTTGSQFEDCWIPKIGTHASQSWNHLFPVLGTTVFQTLEPMLPNLGTVRFRFKKLPVPKDWNLPILEPRVASSRNWQFPLVPSSRNYRFSNIETNAFQSWNRVSTVPGTAGSQDWNQCFRCSEL